MKRSKKLLLIAVLFFASGTVFAQGAQFGSIFIAGGAGGFLSTHSNFSEVYKSSFGKDYFGQLGVSMTDNIYLTGKLTYFHKTGVPVFQTINFINNTTTSSNGGSADFKEWIINAGMIYNFPLFAGFEASVNGGLFYAIVREIQNSSDGSPLFNLSTKSVGLYLGGGMEYHIPIIPVSVFFETQYNLASQFNQVGSSTDYGGLNLNIGARFFINTGL